jgi:hypothetical protein
VLEVLLHEVDQLVVASLVDDHLLKVLVVDLLLPDGEDTELIGSDPFGEEL